MSRPTFHSRYTVGDKQRDCNRRGPRLLDHITSIQGLGEMDSLTEPQAGEFAVIDLRTREKAYVTMPFGCGPDTAFRMIESFFGQGVTRIADKLWMV